MARGDPDFPGRLPQAPHSQSKLVAVLEKLGEDGHDPLKEPFVINIDGSSSSYHLGYSPCITRSRGGQSGHWISWQQRKMTMQEVVQLMGVSPPRILNSPVSNRQVGLAAGNAIPVDLFERVLRAALEGFM